MSFETFTLASIIAEHGRSRRERTAIVDGARRISYGELASRTEALAFGLVERGLGRGDRILWMGQNSGAILELLVAASRIGAIFCAINWRQSVEELAWTITDFKPALLICQQCEVSAQFEAAWSIVAPNLAPLVMEVDAGGALDELLGSPRDLPETSL